MKPNGKLYVVLVDGKRWLTRSGLATSFHCFAAKLPREEADRLANHAREVFGKKAVEVRPL